MSYNPVSAYPRVVAGVERQRNPIPQQTMQGTNNSGTGLLLVVGVGALIWWLVSQDNKRMDRMSASERADVRRHRRDMAVIHAARDVFD